MKAKSLSPKKNSGFTANQWTKLWIKSVKRLDIRKKRNTISTRIPLYTESYRRCLNLTPSAPPAHVIPTIITEAFENSEYTQMSLWVIIAHLLFECKAFVDFCCIAQTLLFSCRESRTSERNGTKQLNSRTGENTKPQRTVMPRPHPARASQRYNRCYPARWVR